MVDLPCGEDLLCGVVPPCLVEVVLPYALAAQLCPWAGRPYLLVVVDLHGPLEGPSFLLEDLPFSLGDRAYA